MTIRAETLMFEVTRRCNMNCPHCLRGCAQNLDMSRDVVNKVLDNIDAITTLQFTGGEPSLNLPLISYIFEEIKRRNIPVTSFWMATNGKANSMELAIELLKAIPYVDDPSSCGVTISVDQFHEIENLRTNPLKFLSFYTGDKEGDIKYIINKGNAAENGVGNYEKCISDCFYFDDYDDNIISVDTIYVSANGAILGDCDVSYEEMEDYTICQAGEIRKYIEKTFCDVPVQLVS